MSTDNRRLCFVALTRPPMRFGVTLTFLMLNGLGSLMLFILTRRLGVPFSMLLLVPLLAHAGGMAACHRDVRFFDVLLGRLAFLGYRNRAFWGCQSYAPQAVHRLRRIHAL